jgi:hypothetical protein
MGETIMRRMNNFPLSVILICLVSAAFIPNLYGQSAVKAGKAEAAFRKKVSTRGFRFDPQNLVVSEFKDGWAVTEIANPKRVLATFAHNRKSDAEKVLKIMQHYGMNEKYFVGTSGLVFFLSSGKAPEDPSPFPGEKCEEFDPKNVTVEEKIITSKKDPHEVVGKYWALVDGKNQLWRFGDDRAMAGMARQVFIRQYGFTNKCNVGGFTYWRK